MGDSMKWLHLFSAIVVVVTTLVVSIKGMTSSQSTAGKVLLSLLVTVCALYLAFQRSTYLPFLGETVMPCSLLKEQTPEAANYEKRVAIQGPGRKVLFWAAEPDTEHLEKINDWRKAYLGFHNAGVTIVGEDNTAVLKVRTPQPYTVPMKGRLEAHIHYRVCGNNGFLGPVQTVFLDEKEPAAPKLREGEKEPFFVAPDSNEQQWASAV
ncbi:MAG: hypothetical protein EBY22_02570 [Gammaproteobacteria bacterium]|nr:hypothetical protein [Gammaproteobacteria bacterium]